MYHNLVSCLAKQSLLHILCSLITPLPGGDLPTSVITLHMLPFIEHRYVPLLGTSLHVPDTRLLLDMYYKELLFFFNLFKISEKVQKIKKT